MKMYLEWRREKPWKFIYRKQRGGLKKKKHPKNGEKNHAKIIYRKQRGGFF
jgi:hypothetical protein